MENFLDVMRVARRRSPSSLFAAMLEGAADAAEGKQTALRR
jgi:hypothetical protein